MNKVKNTLEDYKTLEDWMLKQPDENFPFYGKGQKSFPGRYSDFKLYLEPIHDSVTKGALIKEINVWKDNIKREMLELKQRGKSDSEIANQIEKLDELLHEDHMIYLNCHGAPHVKNVIEKVTEILRCFKSEDRLKSFESFILLCAIQLHDVGNVFGRTDHEHSFASILKKQSAITDTITKHFIAKIAQAHSGNIQGEKDKISKLQLKKTLYNIEIRKRLLAALLRFGDELADDCSRADLAAIEMEIIPEESKIYHMYSKSLHTVAIKKNPVNGTLYVELVYCIELENVAKKYRKGINEKFLLDEIFLRTKKMEQERRYCMYFLSQYLPLNEIKVKIEITNENPIQSEAITYTLSETGYPLDTEISIDCEYDTADKIIKNLKDKGWTIYDKS